MQSFPTGDALVLAQIFVDGAFQRRGIGTEILNRLIATAGRIGRPVTLGIVKSNRARQLHQRLGLRITHQEDRKFYMRRQADVPGSMARKE